MTLYPFLQTWGWLLLLAVISAIINGLAVANRDKKTEYIFKPLTLALLLLMALLLGTSQHSAYIQVWFIPALFFSWCGDIALMFKGNGYFIAGLIAFLLAHICYIIGLNPSLPGGDAGVVFIGVLLLYMLVYPRIDRALRHKGEMQLRIPAALYGVVLSLMLGSAWAVLWRPEWPALSKMIVVLGSSLFYISDLLLAWNRFVKHTHRRDVVVIIAYHSAQILLTATIALGP